MPLPSPDELIAEYRLYDQYVDVVSAFEWLFTATESMPDTVQWFERFPRVTGIDERPATPDFTVLFADGSGIVGEIARIARHDGSVDSLCEQLARYASLPSLPSGVGQQTAVEHVDIVLLVPLELGTATVQRVLRERYANPDHEYAPARPPCVLQFAPVEDKYVIQRRAEHDNGPIEGRGRDPNLGDWLSRGDFNAPAHGFADIKAAKPFMNDPVSQLYLASQLWTKVFATRAAGVEAVGDYKPLVLSAGDIAEDLRAQYGQGRADDVRRAMEVLVAAKAAEELDDGRFRVAWGDLAHQSGEDVSEVLARRTANPPAKGTIRRLQEAYEDLGVPDPVALLPPDQERLFELE